MIHVGFVLTGVLTTLLGPLLPELASRWSIDDLRTGYLFTAQFTGTLVGVILSSFLLVRLGFLRSLTIGFGLMGIGVGALALGAWATGLISVFCYGVGLGFTIPAANLLIAEAYPGRRAAALSTLNLAWGIGAVSLPVAVAVFERAVNTNVLLLGIAAASGLLCIEFARTSFVDPLNPSRQGERLEGNQTHVWTNRFLPILGLLFFLYVGTETALAGWLATYAQRLGARPKMVGVLTPSFVWGGLILGRTFVPTVLRYVTETLLARVGLLLAGAGIAVTLTANTVAIVMAGACVSGLGLAPVFPITIALLSQEFGGAARRAAGVMFALAGLGGATLPWVVGYTSARMGDLRWGLVVPLLGTIVMFILYVTGVESRPRFQRPS